MPQVNPFVKLFLTLLAVLVVLFGWQRADMAALETRLEEHFTRIEERFIALETRLEERFLAVETRFDERFARLEAGQSELRERMARIEGTVAGALARPGSLAQAGEEGEAAAN